MNTVKFVTAHSELNLTDAQIAFIRDLYSYDHAKGSSDAYLLEKFVIACMIHFVEPMDVLKLVVPFQVGYTEPVQETKL